MPNRPKATYENSVFINCPFDESYKSLFRALVFIVQDCGFVPRCALEVDDAGETRLDKIVRLVRDSQFGIHDISRTELDKHNKLPRFNMPYELGLFIGFRFAGSSKQKRKRILVLDKAHYRYQQFFSDIAGQDIQCHENDCDILIARVRNWLQNHSARTLPGAAYLCKRFSRFQNEIQRILKKMHKTEKDLDNYFDLHTIVSDWIDLAPWPY